jgi:hypothetical protein
VKDRLMFLFKKAKSVGQSARDKCVLEKLWMNAVEDNEGIDFFENFSNEKLKSLSDLKNVFS